MQIRLYIEGLVNVDALCVRQEKDIAKLDKEIQGLYARLNNPNFMNKAPSEVVAECQANLAEKKEQRELKQRWLEDLSRGQGASEGS
jgi:valyl-tRNA synthetase